MRAARARGLDGICITEHDALWPEAEIERLCAELDFVVLRGMEVTTEAGHVLVFGLSRHDAAMAELAELEMRVRQEGALMFLAHPGRAYGSLSSEEIVHTFDSVEAHNGTEGMLQNDNAAALARTMRLPGIGGSDAHSVREVAVCATEFETDVRDEPSLVAALRSQAYRARRV